MIPDMKFEVTILGCGSATPTLRRSATAQYVNVRERYFLIDCAEGTQLQLRRYKARTQRIHAVFISHLHGDHYLGLMGLLSTMHLMGRRAALKLYGPPGLMEILRAHWHHGQTTLGFDLVFIPLEKGAEQKLYEDSQTVVHSFPLKHRIDCWGFRVAEQPLKRKVIREAVKRHEVPVAWMKRVVAGEDFVNEKGVVVPNTELTHAPRPPKEYAYCSDTMFDERIVQYIKGADVLYHEATFAELLRARAKETFHSTAKDAAEIAKQANVTKLVLGHFSARYKSTDVLVNEARQIFKSTIAAEDGLVIEL